MPFWGSSGSSSFLSDAWSVSLLATEIRFESNSNLLAGLIGEYKWVLLELTFC